MARTKEQISAYQRAYYQANRERLLAKQNAYDKAHKDERAAYHRSYYAANKDAVAASVAANRAKPRNMAAAAAVTRYRKEHGLTQAAFGRLVGLSQPSVSLLESGQQTIPSRILALVGAEIKAPGGGNPLGQGPEGPAPENKHTTKIADEPKKCNKQMEEFKMENTYYIVRGDRSGVFAGNIKHREGREVTLTNVRRLWYWSGAASLSQLALEGVKRPKDCKFLSLIHI